MNLHTFWEIVSLTPIKKKTALNTCIRHMHHTLPQIDLSPVETVQSAHPSVCASWTSKIKQSTWDKYSSTPSNSLYLRGLSALHGGETDLKKIKLYYCYLLYIKLCFYFQSLLLETTNFVPNSFSGFKDIHFHPWLTYNSC